MANLFLTMTTNLQKAAYYCTSIHCKFKLIQLATSVAVTSGILAELNLGRKLKYGHLRLIAEREKAWH